MENRTDRKEQTNSPLHTLPLIPLPQPLLLLLKELIQCIPIPLKLIKRNRKPTRRRDLIDIHYNNTPATWDSLNLIPFNKSSEFQGTIFHRSSLTPDTDDLGRALKSDEHDAYTTVARLVQVSCSFDAGA
jgi:hypothetical protein